MIEAEKKVGELEEEEDANAVSKATTAQVEKLNEQLQKIAVSGFPALKLIADPESLSRTVEHLFHLSFLVQRGAAKIEFDEEEGPVVSVAEVISCFPLVCL